MPKNLHLFSEGKGVEMRPHDTKEGDRKNREADVPARADEATKGLGNTKKTLTCILEGGRWW